MHTSPNLASERWFLEPSLSSSSISLWFWHHHQHVLLLLVEVHLQQGGGGAFFIIYNRLVFRFTWKSWRLESGFGLLRAVNGAAGFRCPTGTLFSSVL